MSKVMLGWGSYASIRDLSTGRKYYRAYLTDPRSPHTIRLSKKRFIAAFPATAYALVFSARYERLLTACGKYGRVPAVLMSYVNKLNSGDLEDR